MDTVDPVACACSTVPANEVLLAIADRVVTPERVEVMVPYPSATCVNKEFVRLMLSRGSLSKTPLHTNKPPAAVNAPLTSSVPEKIALLNALRVPYTVVAPLINAVPVTDNEPVTVTSPSPRTLNFSDEESSA